MLTKYLNLKAQLKNLRAEMKDELLKDAEYSAFYDDLTACREVLNSYKDKLINDTPTLGAIMGKIQTKANEVKIVKAGIMESIIVTDKNTGEQLSLNLKF